MPTCTPQLCFGNNAPSHESEPDYGSYSLNPGSIEVGEITINNGVIMRGRALRRGRYTRIRPFFCIYIFIMFCNIFRYIPV